MFYMVKLCEAGSQLRNFAGETENAGETSLFEQALKRDGFVFSAVL